MRTSEVDKSKLFVANLKSTLVTSFKGTAIKDVEDVPIGNKEAVEVLTGEATPDEFVNVVMFGKDHPAYPFWDKTPLILTKEWAESFAKIINKTPKPLYIAGHEDANLMSNKARAIPSGYVVGAKVIGNELYLRNRFKVADNDIDKSKIAQAKREIKAGILSTSTGDTMKLRYNVAKDGYTVESIEAIESIKGQSNAIVESDLTGSDAMIIASSFKNGGTDGVAVSSMSKGDRNMEQDLKEVVTMLKNQLDSGKLAVSELANGLGLEVMTEKQRVAMKRLNDAESQVGNITDFVANVTKREETVFNALKEATIKEVFKNDEELVELATGFFTLKKGTEAEIKAEVERITQLKAVQNYQALKATSINHNPTNAGGNVGIEKPKSWEV